jgi:MFS family permease
MGVKKLVEEDNGIILGKDRTNAQRVIAFASILTIYFFYCYNFMLGAFVRPTMTKAIIDGGFGFEMSQASSIFAIMSFATIPGTLVFGMLTTKIGKKKTLMAIALMISAMTFLPLLSPTNFTLWRAARFMTGFALGGVFGTAVPLVTEMFKPELRGKLAAILTSTFSLAMIFGGKVYGMLGDSNWRVLVLTAVIPPVIGAVLTFFFVPDDKELTIERNAASVKSKGEKVHYLSMYKGKYLFIGLGVILLSGMNFTAYSAYSNNSIKYLTDILGMTAVTAGSIYSLQGIGQLVGYNTWGFIADKFGRKVPLVGMAAAAVLVFIFTKLNADAVGTFKVVSVFLGFCFGFSGAWGAYYTELFPKRFSGLAPGISFNGGRIISSFALPVIAGIAATASGMVGIFTVAMGILVAGAVIWVFLPETLGKERED